MLKPETTYGVVYTDAIVRDAVRTFVWRRCFVNQKGLWIAEIALVVMLAWLLWIGERGWGVGALGATVLMIPTLIGSVWIAHYRNTVGKFRSMPTPAANFTISDQGLGVASDLGSGHIPWSGVTEIWERPTYWMIFSGPSQFMTLPIEPVAAADRGYLRAQGSSSVRSD